MQLGRWHKPLACGHAEHRPEAYATETLASLNGIAVKRFLAKLGFLRQPLVFRDPRHPIFGPHIQTVGNTVDVTEVADHLDGDRDLTVAQPQIFQAINIGSIHLPRRQR